MAPAVSPGDPHARPSVVQRVLSEITNSADNAAPHPHHAHYLHDKRGSAGNSTTSKVASAIQHWSRITATAAQQSLQARAHPASTPRTYRGSSETSSERVSVVSRHTHDSKENLPPSSPPSFVRPARPVDDALSEASTGPLSSSSPLRHQHQPADDPFSDTDRRVSQLSSSSTSSGHRHKTHVGPWHLGRTLGRGSSGRVRLAKHAKTGQLAAIKIVPKQDDAPVVGQKKSKDANGNPYGIEREVIIMKLIEHPNVMALYDVWENRGELYLILEYIEGGELFDYLVKKGRLDESEAVHYFRQIILGIDYCHKFNICHRDLKPENLLLDKDHNIKIADFGMAALETANHMLETSCGSPHYASPEIVAGKLYHGVQSDIWSCGVILFALLTGHLPFDDDNIRNLLMKVQAGKFVMPDDLSPEAKDLIWRILRVEPTERINASDILDHSLLRKYPPVHIPDQSLRPPPLRVDQPIQSRSQIDMEIVKNLQTLWHGADPEHIIRRLLSVEPNEEKTFYCLLLKYRHDHRDDEDSTPSSTRSSPTSTQAKTRLAARARAAHAGDPSNTPSRQHKRTTSRSSVHSVSSAHKRNVDFSHLRKRSVHSSSSSMRSVKIQQQAGRRLEEPPLPHTSSLLQGAIDKLAGDSSTAGDMRLPPFLDYNQRQIYDESKDSSMPIIPSHLGGSPGSSDASASRSSSPVVPLSALRASSYALRSNKEKTRTDREDEIRKVSAEFAATLCEELFNFRPNRYASNSSERTTGTASSSSTAPTTITYATSQPPSRKTSGANGDKLLELSFEDIAQFELTQKRHESWVQEVQSYIRSVSGSSEASSSTSSLGTTTTRPRNMSASSMRSASSRPSTGLQPITESESVKCISTMSKDAERFIDADEEDGMYDFAAEIEKLLNTPPVLKRQSLIGTDGLDKKAAAPTGPPKFLIGTGTPDGRAGVAKIDTRSRLRITSLIRNDSLLEDSVEEEDEEEEEKNAQSSRQFMAASAARNVSGGSTFSAASNETTIRHLPPVPVATQRRVSSIGSSTAATVAPVRSSVRSVRTDRNSMATASEAALSTRRSTVLFDKEPTYMVYKPMEFYEDQHDGGDRTETTSTSTGTTAASLRTRQSDQHSEHLEPTPVSPASAGTKTSGKKKPWLLFFHKSLMPKRVAPAPPTRRTHQNFNSSYSTGNVSVRSSAAASTATASTATQRKKEKRQKKNARKPLLKQRRELVEDDLSRVNTTASSNVPRQNWLSKMLTSIL
ncbi:uncharacterized protein V1518DRAFT_286282 [Limtongia smithiae]|uniref:uncharacterized protein n=1 Tax=Limtongia smithiae TaxID=1125753 RepID=UPI0034CFE547